MCTDQAAFTKTVQNSYVRVDFYVRGKSKKGLLLWRKAWMHILARSDGFKLKCLEYGFLYCKHAAFCFTKQTIIDHLEWCGLIVDYCDVFISCLDSHSDGTHSSYVMLNFSKYFSGWSIFSANVHFLGWTIPLRLLKHEQAMWQYCCACLKKPLYVYSIHSNYLL